MNVFSLAFIGDVEAAHPEFPWASLAADALAPDEAAAARRFWSANAFAEHASSIAMAEVVAALGRAQVEPALWRRACAFPADELTHAELCAGVARRCGGTVHVPFDPRALEQPGQQRGRRRCRCLRLQCLDHQPLEAGGLCHPAASVRPSLPSASTDARSVRVA